MNIVAEYLGEDLSGMRNAEALFNELDFGEARIFVSKQYSPAELDSVQAEIERRGVRLTGNVTQSGQFVSIPFQKAIAPLAIIAVVAAVTLAAGGAILGWQIVKSTKMGVPIWVWGLGGLAVTYLLITSDASKATGRAARDVGVNAATQKIAGGWTPSFSSKTKKQKSERETIPLEVRESEFSMNNPRRRKR